MRSFCLLAALATVALLATDASAGPFRRVTRTHATASACEGGNCSSASVRTVTRGGGAQAHAEAMAASGRRFHASGLGCYEGVGSGPSPESAVGACCTNGRGVIDQGVAYGHGQWFACVRRK